MSNPLTAVRGFPAPLMKSHDGDAPSGPLPFVRKLLATNVGKEPSVDKGNSTSRGAIARNPVIPAMGATPASVPGAGATMAVRRSGEIRHACNALDIRPGDHRIINVLGREMALRRPLSADGYVLQTPEDVYHAPFNGLFLGADGAIKLDMEAVTLGHPRYPEALGMMEALGATLRV